MRFTKNANKEVCLIIIDNYRRTLARIFARYVNKLRRAAEADATGEQLILEGKLHIRRANIQPEIGESGQSGEAGQSSLAQTSLQLSTVIGLKLYPIGLEAILAVHQHHVLNLVATIRTTPAHVVPQHHLQIGKERLQVKLLIIAMTQRGKG